MGERTSVLKPIYLNANKDQKRLEFINSLPNFSEWVKLMIDKAIAEKEGNKPQEINPAVAKMIERMIDLKLSNKVVVSPAEINPYEVESIAPNQEILENELSQFF